MEEQQASVFTPALSRKWTEPGMRPPGEWCKQEKSGSLAAPALREELGQSAKAAIIAAVERCSAVSVGWLVS